MTETTITFQDKTYATSFALMYDITMWAMDASHMDDGAERDALVATINEAKALHVTVATPRPAVKGCHWCGLPLHRGICRECGEQF